MARKETILVTSMLLLITYTMSISLVSQAYPQNQTSKTVQSTGNVNIQTTPGIGVYADDGSPLTNLPWNTLEPGQSKTIPTLIKNEGNVPLTISVAASNWNPSEAQNYLTLSWTCSNQPLNPGETAQLDLTLEVDPNIVGITSFSFDITIIGS